MWRSLSPYCLCRLLVYDRRSVQPMYRRLMFLACRRSYRSRDGPFRGFFCSAQLANGPTAHPPTIAPPPESGAWTCVWRYYYGFLSELGRCTRFRHVLDLEWLPFLVGWVRYNDPLISLSGNPSVTSIDVGACHSAALLFLLSPVPHLLLRYSDFAAFLALKGTFFSS